MSKIRLQPSLARDFRIMTIGIIAVAFVILVWVIGSGYNKQAQASLQHIDSDALRIERHMLLTLENTSYVLESLGRQILRSEADTKLPAIDALLEAFTPSSQGNRHVLSWISRQQELVVSNHGGVLKYGVDVSDRDYIKKAVAEPWRLHIGRPIQGRVSGKWVLPMSMGITDDASSFVGVVLMALDVQSLTRQLEEALQTRGLHLAITNRAYTLILEADNSPIDFASKTAVTEILALNFKQQRRHVLSQPNITHPNIYLRVVDAPETLPLRMFYTMHSAAYQQALLNRIVPRMLEVMVVTLFLLFILWNLRRRIVSPVAALTTHTSHVVRGTETTIPDISAPIEVQQLRQEIIHLCKYVEERGHVVDELRSKLAQQNELAKQALQQQSLYQNMATSLLQDIAVLGQHEFADSTKTLLSLLREVRPLLEAKPVNGKMLHEKSNDTSLLVKRAINDFDEQSTIHADIVLDTRASMVWLECDENWLTHALALLFRHEAEQIPTNPRLDITASVRNGAWWLTITRASGDNESPSTAIGIAFARAIMALHDGSVEYQSAATGKRSITLRFPAERVSK